MVGNTYPCIFCGGQPIAKISGQFSVVQSFVQQIGISGEKVSPTDELPLCEDCNAGMTKGVEWGQQMGEVERDVRSLQRIILKMMGQLKSLQDNYLEEMTRLKGKFINFPITTDCNVDAVRLGVINVVNDLGAWKTSQSANSMPPTQTVQHDLQIPEVDPLDDIIHVKLENDHLEESSALVISPEPEDIEIGPVIISANTVKQEPPETAEEDNFILPDDHTPAKTMSKATRKILKGKRKVVRQNLGTSSGEHGFKCPVCRKTFSHSGSLMRHKMVHSDKRPFQCTECDKAFTRSDILETHKRLHTGEKPYACQFCGQRYNQQHQWKRHVRLIHSKKKAAD